MSKWRCVVIGTCKFRFLKFSMFEYVGYNSAVELVLVMALLRTRSELLPACFLFINGYVLYLVLPNSTFKEVFFL